MVGRGCPGLGYSTAISYKLDMFLYLYSSDLGAYTRTGLLRNELRSGNRFLLIKDEVTDTLYICLAIRPSLLVYQITNLVRVEVTKNTMHTSLLAYARS